MNTRFVKFRDSGLSGKRFWNKYSQGYQKFLGNKYHEERIKMVDSLLTNINLMNKNILDFGCGGGEISLSLAKKFHTTILGIDISDKMIAVANSNFKKSNCHGKFLVGDTALLNKFRDGAFDVVLCINVLAYFDHGQDKEFYRQTHRLLKKGGFLIIIGSNELFDLFTFNAFTVSFFKKHFINRVPAQKLEQLITNYKVPRGMQEFNIRFNPLNYKFIMADYGFKEVQQEFAHYHSKPPLLLKPGIFEPIPDLKEEEKWKLFFKCSIYGSRLLSNK